MNKSALSPKSTTLCPSVTEQGLSDAEEKIGNVLEAVVKEVA